jgi:hypothetical protein
MEKTIEKLMEQAEECLKEYSKKTEWTAQDVECTKNAVSLYEKLQRILLNKDELEHGSEEEWSARGGMRSHARGRDAMTGRFVSRRAPRYYDYNGSLTSYGDEGSQNRDGMQSMAGPHYPEWNSGRRMSYGPNDQSMHSISDRMVQKLESLYDEADSDYERNQIREMVETARSKNR